MRSPAQAMAWEFGRRHRIGFVAVLAYLLIVSLGLTMLPEAERKGPLAGMTSMPLWAAFMYLVAVFSFGFETDLVSRESCYPARKFSLPVGTAALVGWPMLYGTVTAALLWVAVALLIFRPCGMVLPVVWPALQAAATLAWTQVVLWTAFGLPWLRAIAGILVLASLVAGPMYALSYGVTDTVLVAVLGSLLPAAYVAACVTTSRARRGDVPDWRWLFARPARLGDGLPRRNAVYSSAAQAQVWFEWRRHGRSLPFLVGVLLPFALMLLFFADVDTPDVVLSTIVGVLLLPLFMAVFATTLVSKANPHVRDYYGLSAFTATRPLTSAALVAAKLKMAAWSTLAAWLLVVTAVPLALTLSGNWPVVLNWVSDWLETESPVRVAAIVILVALGLVIFTWKQLVQNLYIGLTGREWLIKSSVFFGIGLFIVLGPLGKWVYDHKEYHADLWKVLPWLAGGAVCLKMTAVGWIVRRLRRQQLLGDRALVTIGTCWLLLVLGLFGLLAWLVPARFAPWYLLALGAVLVLPLARPAAAPLALAWNRHR